jgi:hypothetical protein
MNNIFPMFALAGLGDVSEWILFLVISVWPFHISSALGVTSTMTLHGYSPAAVAIQCLGLFLLLAAAPRVFREGANRPLLKALYLPVGDPVVTLSTNLIPGFL